jgi:hypothetical protein
MKRPLCEVCRQRACAVNYHRDGLVHYRSRCEHCIRRGRRQQPPTPRWQTRGFQKKLVCDLCGFRARYGSQILVYHMDGNLNNSELRNLRCVCRNCVEVVTRADFTWRRGDLEPDF